jgi:hypothetical protein
MTSDKPDNLRDRLDVIKAFTDRDRCLTLLQLSKILGETVDIKIIGQIVESLIINGIITQCGLTKCQWTGLIVETFHAKETD